MPTSLSVTAADAPGTGWQELADRLGLFYHQPRWIAALAGIFRFRPVYLEARRGDEVVGILPLLEVPALLGPRRLVSLPFSYAAGPVTNDAEAAERLAGEALTYASNRRISRVEIKQVAPAAPAPSGFHRVQHYSVYRVPTEGGEADVWQRLHPGSTRRSIRKAERAGVTVAREQSADAWTAMAELEERTAHKHGLPAPPRRFFLGACRDLQQHGLSQLYLARLPDGKIAAGIVVWTGPRDWIYGFGASDPATLAARPNHLLIWTALRDAIAAERGFDLGRAAPEQTGLVEFKVRWGGQPIPLAYDYWPAPGGLNVASRDRGSLALAARIWSRLPLPVARAGSVLYRYLG